MTEEIKKEETQKEQPKETKDSNEPKNVADAIDKFKEQIELADQGKPNLLPKEEVEPEVKAEEKEVKTETKAKEDDCTDCNDKGEKPIRTVKIDGKPRNFYSEEEVNGWLSKNINYTQDKQKLAAERQDVVNVGNKMDEIWTHLKANTEANPLATPGVTTKPVEAQKVTLQSLLGDDIDLLEDETKKVLETVIERSNTQEDKMKAYEANLQQTSTVQQRQEFENVGAKCRDVKAKALEEFPVDEINNGEGVDYADQQFKDGLSVKLLFEQAKPKEQQTSIFELTKQQVKEVSMVQKAYKAKYGAGIDKMTSEQFSKANPELFNAVKELGRTEQREDTSDSEPMVKGTKGEVSFEKSEEEPKDVHDAFVKARKDSRI